MQKRALKRNNIDLIDDTKSASSQNEFVKRLQNLSKANSKECTQGTDSSKKTQLLKDHFKTERNITTFNNSNDLKLRSHLNIDK